MKSNFATIVLAVLVLGSCAFQLYNAMPAHAQFTNQPLVAVIGASTVGGCPAPTYTGNSLIGVICTDPQNVNVSTLQNPAYVAIPLKQAAAGVTSFNARTGAIVPLEADYTGILKFADLAAPPTQLGITCPTASIGATGFNSGTTNCTISALK